MIVTMKDNSAFPFAPTGNVTFTLYKSTSTNAALSCRGYSETFDTVAIGSDGTVESKSFAFTPGFYGFSVSYAGDSNYNGSTAACEPFRVVQAGKTMGFWGNTNGQARLLTADLSGHTAFQAGYASSLGFSGGCYVV